MEEEDFQRIDLFSLGDNVNLADKALGQIPDGTLPWTRSCFVCGQENPHGLRLKSRVEGGRVVLDYVTRASDLGWRHLVHGGILATLLDEVMTWVAILETGAPCVAAEITTRLVKPVPEGTSLRCEGEVIRCGRRLILTAGTLLTADGQPAATATGKYVPMPATEGMALCSDDFVLSPDAIDPAQIMRVAPGGLETPSGGADARKSVEERSEKP